ncbi:MAG: ATP synthase F1 subunit epsilon [Lachnospiraceae bacterium]|nr:ATP synthase F1 subunit epsilon [Lachnospiraceae bacterium]
MADAGKQFRLKIISPDRIFYDADVEMVELRTTEGEMGVLKDHIPLTAILVPGVLNIKGSAEGDKEAALHSGFVEIMQDHVTILAESCEWPDEIDLNRAKEAQIRAERRLKSGDSQVNIARAELALRRSLIRIELAEKRM